MLHKHCDCPAVIIIDEYETPIQQGHLMGFYDEAVSFMRGFFSGGLKDNRSLAFGFLTGILRVAKESIFSELNNIVVNSVLDRRCSSCENYRRKHWHRSKVRDRRLGGGRGRAFPARRRTPSGQSIPFHPAAIP